MLFDRIPGYNPFPRSKRHGLHVNCDGSGKVFLGSFRPEAQISYTIVDLARHLVFQDLTGATISRETNPLDTGLMDFTATLPPATPTRKPCVLQTPCRLTVYSGQCEVAHAEITAKPGILPFNGDCPICNFAPCSCQGNLFVL